MTDNQLWDQVKAGNQLAFKQIVDKYQPILLGFILGKINDLSVSEDISQDVWMKVYQKKEDVNSIRPYLFTVAKNRINDFYRKIHPIKEPYSDGETPTVSDTDSNMILEDQNHEIKSLIDPKDFEIFSLSVKGYDNEEIAKQLDMNEKTVANRRSIIKKKLKENFNSHG